VAPNICGSCVWNSLPVSLQSNRILRWLLDFRKNSGPLGTNLIDRDELPRRPSVGLFQIVARYGVSFSTAFDLYLHLLISLQSTSGFPSHVQYMSHSLSYTDTALIVGTH